MAHPQSNGSLNAAGGTFFLGRYRVVDEIGVGGMASVHLARMDGPGGFQKWVAIKRIHSHLIEEESFVQMFLDEAMIAARISHPNVATVFDLGKDNDTHWIAMEYLHGEPLREIMRKSEETGYPMPPEIACKVIADAAEGLHAAHELTGKNGEKLGLVHRDVTPHNLFVTYEGVTKVVDFGIAKFNSRLSSSTRAGTLKGKLAYMSPEQVHGESIDRRTDIFALGVVLWELTTGQRLFRMDNDLDTLAKVQECNVPRPSTIVRGYPMDLEKIVLKALVKNRADRYRTAREFSRALQSFFLRRGLFIASEEVAACMQAAFEDRIAKRDAHLRWAAEVTQTVNIDQLRGEAQAKAVAGAPAGVRPAAGEPAKVLPAAGRPALHDDHEDGAPTLAVAQPSQRNPGAPRPRPAAGIPARAPGPAPTLQEDSQVDLPTVDTKGMEDEVETQLGRAARPINNAKPRTPTITGASLKQVIGSSSMIPNLAAEDEEEPGDKTEVDVNLLSEVLERSHDRADYVPTVSPPAGYNNDLQVPPAPIPFSTVPGGVETAPRTMPRINADSRTVTAQAIRQKRSNWLIVAIASAAVAAIGLLTLIIVLVSGPSKTHGASPATTDVAAKTTGPFSVVRTELQAALTEVPHTEVQPQQPQQQQPQAPAAVTTIVRAPDPVKAPEVTRPVEAPKPASQSAAKPAQVDVPRLDSPPKVDAPKAAKAGGTGYLTVVCLGTPCTQIYLDGSPISSGSNVVKFPVSAGSHSVKMVRGSASQSRGVTIEPGVTQRVSSSG